MSLQVYVPGFSAISNQCLLSTYVSFTVVKQKSWALPIKVPIIDNQKLSGIGFFIGLSDSTKNQTFNIGPSMAHFRKHINYRTLHKLSELIIGLSKIDYRTIDYRNRGKISILISVKQWFTDKQCTCTIMYMYMYVHVVYTCAGSNVEDFIRITPRTLQLFKFCPTSSPVPPPPPPTI
jgi:hypothetical protein